VSGDGITSAADFHQQHFNVAGANERTVEFVRSVQPACIAEIGIYEGATSIELAQALGEDGWLHLFDFEDRVSAVQARLADLGFTRVVAHGNSAKALDSYNWSLMRLLRDHDEPIFDYVFLDGAHVWHLDALAFLLVDRLLRPGGHIDFDDYAWSIAASPTMAPNVNLPSAELYTEEQMQEQHVRLIVDLLVRRDDRFVEVVPNKIFRKERA
jgi:predicted O-methyltransferase YrrM